MNKKINNLKEIEYYTNDMYFAWQQIGFYVHNHIMNEKLYDESLSEYRADKIRAVERARKADELVKDLQEQIQKLKTRIELGI